MKIYKLSYILLFMNCSLYVEDLKSAYNERDGIYKVTEKQETMQDDIFYSSFFNSRKNQIENISSREDFVSLKKDTMYKKYLEVNYYGYDIEKPNVENKKDSLKIFYERKQIYSVENEKEYVRYINPQSYYDNIDFSVYNFDSDIYYQRDYDIGYNNYYYGNVIYNSNKNNKKRVKSVENDNNFHERERRSYDEFRQRGQNNNNIRNENEYNRRSTNRRRR